MHNNICVLWVIIAAFENCGLFHTPSQTQNHPSVCAAATSDTTKATLADVGLVRRAVSLLAIHRPAHSSTKVRQGAAQILECLAVPCTVAHFLGDVCVSVPTMNVHGETMVQQRRVNVLDVALQVCGVGCTRRS